MPEFTDPSKFASMANFGAANPDNLSMGSSAVSTKTDTVSQASALKKELLQQKSAEKKAIYGSPAPAAVDPMLVTAAIQRNDLALDDERTQDMLNMGPLDLAKKYGFTAAAEQAAFARQYREKVELKNAERSGRQVAGDSLMDVGLMAANTVGNTGIIAAQAGDSLASGARSVINDLAETELLPEPTPIAPRASEAMAALNEAGRAQQSDLMQARRQQHAIEAQLDQMDSENQYQEELAENAGSDSTWDSVAKPWLKKTGRDFGDAVANYADDPIMTGSLVPEGVGSLLPATAAIRAVGKVGALAVLAERGLSKKAAKEFLKTKAGKELVDVQSVKGAPAIIGASEGGAAVVQTQQAILEMTPEELTGTEDYDALIAEGKSHEQAQRALASDAGAVAGVTALPGALIAGRLSAPFAAKPLSVGTKTKGLGSSIVAAGQNLASEGVEETLQEANSQLASNIGQREGAGLDVDLDEGVAAAGAQGLLGGLATAGPMQAPGALGGSIVEAGRTAGRVGTAAINERQNQVEESIDADAPAGSTARKEAGEGISTSAETILSEVTPDQSTPNDTDANSTVIKDTVQRAAYLDAEEASEFAQAFPSIKKALEDNPDAPVSRAMAVEAAGEMLNDKDASAENKMVSAVAVIDSLNDMRRTESSDMQTAIAALPEDSPARIAHAELADQVKTLNSSPAVKAATKIIYKMTSDDISKMLPIAEMQAGQLDTDTLEGVQKFLDTVGQINPTAASLEQYDMVLDQVGGGKGGEILRKSLEISRSIAAEFFKADQAKKDIEANQNEVIEALPEDKRKSANSRKHNTADSVREDILIDGNKTNAMPSLNEHRRRFSEAMSAGQTDEAVAALGQLRSFAEALTNKIGAYNQSAAEGKGKPVGFASFGPFGNFQDETGVYANTKSPNSVALVSEAWVDTSTAVGLYNAMLSDPRISALNGETQPLTVPTLGPSIVAAAGKLDFSPVTPKQITPKKTEEAAPVEEQIELIDEDDVVDETFIEEPETGGRKDRAPTPKEEQIQPEPPTSSGSAEGKSGEEEDQGRTEETEIQEEKTDAPLLTEKDDGTVDDVIDNSEADKAGTTWVSRLKDRLLTNKDGVNQFIKSFSTNSNGSTLVSEDSVKALLEGSLADLRTDKNGMERELDSSEQESLKNILDKWLPAFTKAFNTEAENALTKSRGKNGTLMERLDKDDQDVLSFPNALPLNFMGRNEDGTYEMDQTVVQASVMGVLEWVMKNETRGAPRLDNEDISKLFGMGRNGHVTKEMREAAQQGLNIQTALSEIAGSIQRLLGVTAGKDASIKMSQGMFKAMAATALEITEASGMVVLNSNTVEIPKSAENPNGKKTLSTVIVGKEYTGKDVLDGLKSMPDIFTRIFTDGTGKERFVGSAPKNISKTQLKNKFGRLSKMEQGVVKRLQDTPFYVNTSMTSFLDAMGEDLFKDMLGYQDTTKGAFNPTAKASIDGKNVSLTQGVAGLRGYLSEASSLADSTGSAVSDVPIHFAWRISKVGRLQQQGPVTPQGDKIMREMVTATNATIDLTDPVAYDQFWLTVAQSADISVEKRKHPVVVAEAYELMFSDTGFAPALDILADWIDVGTDKPMTSDQRNSFKDAVDNARDESGDPIEVTAKLLHALVTVARMQDAMTKGGEAQTQFKTSLSLEADGKTDGPINAMIHMGAGIFNADEIKRFAKGGLFFTDQETSLNDYIEDRDNEDLYQAAAKLFEGKLSAAGIANKDNPQFASLMRVMDSLLPDFELGNVNKDGEFTPAIKRGLTKNPLTVMLYGSGVGGISGKITAAMLGEFHTHLNDLAQGIESGKYKTWRDHAVLGRRMDGESGTFLIQDMASIIGSSLKSAEGQSLANALTDPSGKFTELSSSAVSKLTESVQENFGELLAEAVDEATGGLGSNMKATQQLSSIQTLIFQDAYKKAVEKVRGDRPVTALSERELQDAFQETMKVAPIYETDAQEFHISSGERQGSSSNVSRSLNGQLSAGAVLPAPSDASVKVSPYMTIGTGDGRMILNIYANSDGSLDTSLAVFDGVELAANNIEAGSRQINRATFEGWMDGNIYRSISDGYRQMLPYVSPEVFENLDQGTKDGIKKALGLKKKETPEHYMLQEVFSQIDGLADQSQARKAAIKRMHTWTDHMASAMAPHENPGEVAGDLEDFKAIADQLNIFMSEELKKTQTDKAEKDTAPVIQKEDAQMVKAVEEIGEVVAGHDGVTKLTGKQALGLLGKDKELLGDISNIGQTAYFFGTSEALQNMRDDLYPGLTKQEIQLGQTHPGSGVVFISNIAPETVLHEMLHTQTAKVLTDYYNNPTSSSEEIQGAMQRLEVLMEDVLSMDPGSVPESNVGDALNILKGELTRRENNPAARMSEFISWTLSNQNLIEFGKKQKARSPLVRVAVSVLRELKKLLGISTVPGISMFSNIRFNTQVLLAPSTAVAAAKADAQTEVVLDQVFGADSRLKTIEKKFLNRLNSQLIADRDAADNTIDQKAVQLKAAKVRQMSRDAAEQVSAQGFGMNLRESQAFQAVHAAMMSGMDLDPSTVRRLNKMFRHTIENLTTEDLLIAVGLTSETASDADQSVASRKLAVLTGDAGLRRTSDGRTDLLATFVALAQVDQSFRDALQNMKAPKDIDLKWDSVDNALRSTAQSAVSMLTRLSVTRQSLPRSVGAQLDILSNALSDTQGERRFIANMLALRPVDRAEEYVSSKIEKGSREGANKIQKVRERLDAEGKSRVLTGALGMAELVISLGSKSASADAGESITKMLNHTPRMVAVRELMTDIRGMTGSNASLMKLINRVKAQIDAIRQDYRENLPEHLAKKFNRKLKKQEWSRLHKAIGQADVLALGRKKASQLLAKPGEVSQAIRTQEELLASKSGSLGPKYVSKAKALAEYMVNKRVTSINLLRNADAIAHLYGEAGPTTGSVTPDLIKTIDELVSLYALDLLDDQTKKTLADLSETEANGMEMLTGVHFATRAMEIDRLGKAGAASIEIGQNNGWKGYVPSNMQDGASLTVVDDSEHKEMVLKGFTRVGPYVGDVSEGHQSKRSYYQSTVSGRNAFRQGVAQTVHSTYQGVDARTGVSKTGDMAGLVTGSQANNATRRKKLVLNQGTKVDGLKPGDYLLPVLSAEGKVVAYERPMDPDKLLGMSRDTHLGRMLGVWAGRILEETEADKFNRTLVETLKKIHDEQSGDRADEFVNVADPRNTDPIVRDAWQAMGMQIKKDAADVFGQEKYLPVRRDMLNDAIGYRAAGVTDPWTGITRFSPEVQENIKNTATFILGKDAFKRLSQAEGLVHDGVSYAKTTIIVRSLLVGVENILSNVQHLIMNGMNPITASKAMRNKFVEITQYSKNKERIGELNADLAANYQNPVKAKKLRAQILALEDANAGMSIKALIDAGEFSTVSENLTEADLAIRQGGIADYLDKAVEKLPGFTKTVAKNLMVTKDTALFQGLNRMVQYGDFVAKAALYDHLIDTKKMNQEEALDVIAEEFVNYNRLAGRGRDFLESIGLMWFYNYKLRIMKIAVKMARERPLSSLMYGGYIGPALDVDTVMSGSIAGAVASGRYEYSLGMGMGLNSGTLNPWYNLIN